MSARPPTTGGPPSATTDPLVELLEELLEDAAVAPVPAADVLPPVDVVLPLVVELLEDGAGAPPLLPLDAPAPLEVLPFGVMPLARELLDDEAPPLPVEALGPAGIRTPDPLPLGAPPPAPPDATPLLGRRVIGLGVALGTAAAS